MSTETGCVTGKIKTETLLARSRVVWRRSVGLPRNFAGKIFHHVFIKRGHGSSLFRLHVRAPSAPRLSILSFRTCTKNSIVSSSFSFPSFAALNVFPITSSPFILHYGFLAFILLDVYNNTHTRTHL